MNFAALLFALSLTTPSWAHNERCRGALDSEAADLAQAVQISHEVATAVEKSAPGKMRGYSILIGSMVGSAALTSYLTSMLPPRMQFLSLFCAQISTLGVYVFGSPIWDPLASGFRKMAFGISEDPSGKTKTTDPDQQKLERIWKRLQNSYSLNAQISKNMINSFLSSTRQNFFEAHRAMHSNDPHYAADQVAEAAFRMRRLFREIPPDEISVRVAAQTAFTRHGPVDENFKKLVLQKLSELDPQWEAGQNSDYYHQLLSHWLEQNI